MSICKRYRVVCICLVPGLLLAAILGAWPAGGNVASASGDDIYTANDVASLPPTFSLLAIDGVNVPYQSGIPVPSFERQGERIAFDLGGTWKKERVSLDHDLSLTSRSTALAQIEVEANGRHTVQYDDSGWDTKTLPAVENTMPPYEDPGGAEIYEDGVWYRRTFVADAQWSGKYVKLVFHSVSYVADVWINGTWVGCHEGGYTPFAFDASSCLNYGDSNTMAVRVDNVPWGTRTDTVPAVNSDWMNYTGIIQDLYLEVCDPVNIVRADVRPLNVSGDLSITLPIFNDGDSACTAAVDLQVFDTSVTSENITDPCAQGITNNPVSVEGTTSRSVGISAGETRVLTYSIRIPSPSLWSPENPNLYVLKATLRKDGNFVEDFYTQFGVRTLGIGEGAKLLLNDHAVFLVGEARHEDWWDSGRTATMNKIKGDLDVMQAANVNFLRTAHYPNHPYTYILGDRMGFAISEELPAWWHGTYEWADQNHRLILDQMWREMIFRDFNRPSIILWSTMNEGEGSSMARRRATIERLHRDLDLNYNDGRFVIQAASADRPGADDHSQNATDVAAWTMYFGVFHGGTHYQGTLDFMDEAHINFPDKPILNIEYGRISQLDDSEAGEQDTTFNETFSAFEDRKAVDAAGDITPANTGYLAGTMWWTAFNWYTQREMIVQSQGATHMDRTTHKPVYSSIPTRHAPYFNQGGLSTDTLTPTVPPPPGQTVPEQPGSVPPTLLQDFEYEDSGYRVFQAEAILSTEIKHGGNSSLKMTGTGGEWHTVGAYLYDRPLDVTSATQICVWIYDTVGRHTVGMRLWDKYGVNQEVWSNGRTQLNKWKQVCLSLSDYDQVDLSTLAKVEMCMYWDGVYYFDDIAVDQISPTPTPTATTGPTATPTATATAGPSPTPTATPEGTVMHVEDIYTTDVGGSPKDIFNKGETVYWRVQILDQGDDPVEGASVRTDILKPDSSPWTNQTTTTDEYGWAFYNKKTRRPDPSGTYTIDVTSVTKDGASYDPEANVKDSHQYTLQ